jgi:hypothetical protein
MMRFVRTLAGPTQLSKLPVAFSLCSPVEIWGAKIKIGHPENIMGEWPIYVNGTKVQGGGFRGNPLP